MQRLETENNFKMNLIKKNKHYYFIQNYRQFEKIVNFYRKQRNNDTEQQ